MIRKQIGCIRVNSFLSPKGYYWDKKYRPKKDIEFIIWKQSWDNDLDIIWFHIFRWYFCMQYIKYFFK